MSIPALFWFNRGIYAIILTAAVVSVGVAYWLNDFFLLTLVAVAYGTIFLRDAANYWRSQSTWPVLRQVIEWDKLRQLALAV
ncbi:hypothetical protein [Dokdonella immobilis]|uniref:Uncharacterized protein n=1 Tax=Dokdonella immobilis TaxID=578942 RepID=A0A1I4YHV7_9GAMM|nr:hypothetical protein [Dokdonella immobilis]SFN37607.1 hypothetical protein SAMN05216289_11785 [Dokdonella immobilis]